MRSNRIRIIGGKWRGRKLQFPDLPELRPTPDRVRETVFNWLMPVIREAHGLDLYAGSGALGFEALSRGAAEVVFIDQHPMVIAQLEEHCQTLHCENAVIHHAKAEAYIAKTTKQFDIVFLDPPFKQNILPPICDLIEEKNILKPEAHIYIESETKDLKLPQNWQIIKKKQIGQVHCFLALKQ